MQEHSPCHQVPQQQPLYPKAAQASMYSLSLGRNKRNVYAITVAASVFKSSSGLLRDVSRSRKERRVCCQVSQQQPLYPEAGQDACLGKHDLAARII